MVERHFFTDVAETTLHYAGDDTIDVSDDFEASQAETVILDTQWEQFFDTNEFVQFEATVAQPIVQPYFHDGELKKFRKDEAELKEAQAQIDNLSWTMGHPENKRVETADQIRGFWKDPSWNDGQKATLNIPANDTEAVRFAIDNDEVSIGFSGVLDWTDDEADAVQRKLAYDHIASVENGRCSPEEGCGLHTDSVDVSPDDVSGVTWLDTDASHNTTDGVQTTVTEENDAPDGIHVSGDDWYGIAPSETSGDSPKYELNNCNDVKDAYNLRNNGDYDVETSTLVSRIKRAAQAHNCDDERKPWTDDTDCPCDDTETDMTNLEELFSDNDITKEQILDHYEIEQKESPTEFYDGEPSVEELADDFDAVDILVDEKESLEQKVDSLKEEAREAKRPVFADKAEKLADLTEKWGDEDDLMEKFDAEDEDERWTVDEIDEKIEMVEDIRGEDTTTVNDSTEETEEEPDLDVTRHGRFDLRSRTKVN